HVLMTSGRLVLAFLLAIAAAALVSGVLDAWLHPTDMVAALLGYGIGLVCLLAALQVLDQ
ncbi:MAG: hypothetical protein ABIZ71_01235, partial [Gemmatimonadales bacterium]